MAVRDEQIEPSIAIEIDEARAEAHPLTRHSRETADGRHIQEAFRAHLAKQRVVLAAKSLHRRDRALRRRRSLRHRRPSTLRAFRPPNTRRPRSARSRGARNRGLRDRVRSRSRH